MPEQRDDHTVPAPGTTTGTEETMASAPGGADETMASAPGGTDAVAEARPGSGGRATSSVRRGQQDDYAALVAVDPKHYAVGSEIARGGMGRIVSARDRRLGRAVAIKELLHHSADGRARFEREARITARLQHPAVINILEAGHWPNGEPFYVMKLVTGESMDRVIARRATIEERLGLLPAVIATVDALAYAHTHRIIHRDLKPGNVLVGEFGETVVIDWGLAKDLSNANDADLPAGPYRQPAPGAGETVAGSVMGTPAYMPLEQAAGENLDERADVYALGAVLYHVLAGVPPYQGRSSDEVLGKVLAGPPLPLAEVSPAVPTDLSTIVDKAMARDARDRYASARQLADDLKKFQTGQLVGAHRYTTWQLIRRWLRRHRAPVAVGVAAFALLVAIGAVSIAKILREQARTREQRVLAEQSRGEAEDLLSFMMVDLRDKLEPLGKVELLEEVARKAIAYYARRPTSGEEDERKRSLALFNLGNVLDPLGDLAGALEQHRAALAIRERLAARHPDDAGLALDLARSHGRIGIVLLAQGELDAASTSFQRQLAILEPLARRVPSDTDVQRALSIGHEKIADVLAARGDSAGALAAYRTSFDVAAELVRRDPANRIWQRDLATSHDKRGAMLRAQGDTNGALMDYRAAMTIRERLVAQEPANGAWKRDLVISHLNVGDGLVAQGDGAGALAAFRAARDLAAILADADASNADLQHVHAVTVERFGDVQLATGDAAGALESYRADLAIHRDLAARDPSNRTARREVHVAHNKVGDVLLAQGDADGAIAAYQAGLVDIEAITAGDPSNTAWQRDLGISKVKLGDALAAKQDLAGALTWYRSGLADREKLAATDAGNAEWQRSVALAHQKLATVLDAQGHVAEALVEARAAMAVQQQLALRDPTNATLQIDVEYSHYNIGTGILKQGDAVGAVEELRLALAIAVRLADKDPSNVGRQFDVADCRDKLGDALLATGDRAGARAEAQAASEVMARLAAANPQNAQLASEAARLAKKASE